MLRAVVGKQILWPEKGEDKSEGGFVMEREGVEEEVLRREGWGRERGGDLEDGT